MTDDIVARLRVWSDWLNERCPDTEVRNDLRAAADEIERLRRDYSCICSEMRRMMEDRDEARRECCMTWEAVMGREAQEVAADKGWDCYKENP